MLLLNKQLEIEIQSDLYAMRVRGYHPQILLNDGYAGVFVLDLSGQQSGRIAFPDDDYDIYSWLVSPRGDVSFVTSSDQGSPALLLDHQAQTATAIAMPSDFGVASEVGWFSPELAIMNYDNVIWKIQGGHLVKATSAESDRRYTRDYRRITKRFGVVKTDPYQTGLYVRSREYETKTIGFISLEDPETKLLMEQDGTAIDVTRFQDVLFVNFESEIVQQRGNEKATALVAPEGKFFVRVNVVETGGRGYLVVLASGEDHLDQPQGQILVFALEESK